MNGNRRFLLDTNAVVSLLAGNRDLAGKLETAEYVGISVITYLEFLAFDGLSDNDRDCFEKFAELVEVVPLAHDDSDLMSKTLDLRSRFRMKLPDAIIGATALPRKSCLITNDSHFGKVEPLTVQSC
jgi:predicted nucleic acid-binding protein